MNLARPRPSTAPLDAAASALRDWLNLFSVWLVELIDYCAGPHRPAWIEPLYAHARRDAVRELRAAASDLRWLLAAQALLRAEPGPTGWVRHRPPSAARGFRRGDLSTRWLRSMVNTLIGPLHRGSLRQRTERLQAMFDNLDALIARAVRRLESAMRCQTRIAHILIFARDGVNSLAAPPVRAADSS